MKIRARQQLERLVSQLSDLESIKNDLDSEEYEDAKSETLDQLQEFEKSLNKLDCGEVTLEFTARAILTEAFRTPDIIKLFMSKRSDGLRQKLQEITRDNTIGKLGWYFFLAKRGCASSIQFTEIFKQHALVVEVKPLIKVMNIIED